MPIYVYRCGDGHITEDIVPVFEPRATVDCSVCGKPASRSYSDEGFSTDLVSNERWSESMGVNVEQISQAQKTFPGSEYHPETGALKIKNRKHKVYEMKRRGYSEL